MKRIKNLTLRISILAVMAIALTACGSKQTMNEMNVETTKAVETTAVETVKETVAETVPETTVEETTAPETEAMTGSAVDAYVPDDNSSVAYKELYETFTTDTMEADTAKTLWLELYNMDEGNGGAVSLTYDEYEKLYAIVCEITGEELGRTDEAGFQASAQAATAAADAVEGLSEWGNITLLTVQGDLENTLSLGDTDWDLFLQYENEYIDSCVEPENEADRDPNMRGYITKEEAAFIHEYMDNWIAENVKQ